MNKLKKTNLENTIEKNKWKRNCPKCDCELFYTLKGNRDAAQKNKNQCKLCQNKECSLQNKRKKLSLETKNKLSKSLKGRKILWKDKISIARKKFYKENPDKLPTKNKNPMFGSHRIGRENPNYGNKWNKLQKHKAKLISKEHFLKRKEKLGLLKIGYNPKACEYFNKLNKEKGWNLQHALNGGEQRVKFYFLDAYDKDRNIVIEYDESYHFYKNGKIKDKDIKRMNEIKNYLQCKFLRYNELTNQLKEYE